MTNSRPCPICKNPRNERFSPFCSKQCKDRDLLRWFGEGYAVAGEKVTPEQIANDFQEEN